MNQILEKIRIIYQECKSLAEHYETSEVMFNTGEAQRKIMDEYARQINITNTYRQKEKDLYFILSLLQEAKGGLSSAPTGQKMVKQVDTYTENVKALLKVYQTIEQMQVMIVKYYERGGATF